MGQAGIVGESEREEQVRMGDGNSLNFWSCRMLVLHSELSAW